jgi:hypothetical protein
MWSLASLITGTALILAGLWNRDRERLAVGLFAAGAVLVVLTGILALQAGVPQD